MFIMVLKIHQECPGHSEDTLRILNSELFPFLNHIDNYLFEVSVKYFGSVDFLYLSSSLAAVIFSSAANL